MELSPIRLTGSSPHDHKHVHLPTSVTRWSSPNRNNTCWARPSVLCGASSTGFMVGSVVAPDFGVAGAAGPRSYIHRIGDDRDGLEAVRRVGSNIVAAMAWLWRQHLRRRRRREPMTLRLEQTRGRTRPPQTTVASCGAHPRAPRRSASSTWNDPRPRAPSFIHFYIALEQRHKFRSRQTSASPAFQR